MAGDPSETEQPQGRYPAGAFEAAQQAQPQAQDAPPPLVTNSKDPVGKTVSHYRVLDHVGGGGMGVVYRAQDLKLGRSVALKFLPEEFGYDPRARERFEREARAASALDHPNICPIYEFGEHDGRPFIVMQLLRGQTLKDMLATAEDPATGAVVGKALPTDQLLGLAIQILEGLEAAHEKGIIHRDIKPANIFITQRGVAKILDFGLVKLLQPDGVVEDDDQVEQSSTPPTAIAGAAAVELSRAGVALGTAAYMSPEQIRGEKLDPRTDLFCFGLLLYEMATGRRAFTGEDAATLRNAILTKTPVPVRQLNHHQPARLERIINKSIEKDPARRYQHAANIRSDLEKLQRSRHHPLRRRWKLAVASVVVVAGLVAGAIWHLRPNPKMLKTDTIVLADVSNSTGDPVFDGTLKQALSVALSQSPFLNVLSENKVEATLHLMARPANTVLTSDVAADLCQRAGSKAYIAGSIAKLGSQYVLGLNAVNCQTGDVLAQEQVTAPAKEKVLDALGQATSKLRRELGESLATVRKYDAPLEQATTPSLEALKAYTLGVKAQHEKDPMTALPYFERAVQLDPNFAMAYRALGAAYWSMGESTKGNEYYTKAFQLRDRLSERERLIITADYYRNITGERQKAAQTFRELIESYPQEYRSYTMLGNEYLELGEYRKALDPYHESLRIAPDVVSTYHNLATSLMALQRFDEAHKVIDEAHARKLESHWLQIPLYALAFLAGDSPAMAEQLAWFASKPEYENDGLSLASDTEAYQGHVDKARKLTDQAISSAARANSKEPAAVWQENAALREAAFGDAAEARRLATQGLKRAPESQSVMVEAALALAMTGDTARAESLAQELNKRYPLDTQVQSLWLPTIQAQLALNRKDAAAAVDALQAALPIELAANPVSNNTSCLYHTYVRGQAHLALGQGAEAAAEFAKLLDHSGLVWNCWTGALARLGLARAYDLQRSSAPGVNADVARKSAAAYEDFLTLWKDADPEIPVLKQAKAEYERLQRPGP